MVGPESPSGAEIRRHAPQEPPAPADEIDPAVRRLSECADELTHNRRGLADALAERLSAEPERPDERPEWESEAGVGFHADTATELGKATKTRLFDCC